MLIIDQPQGHPSPAHSIAIESSIEAHQPSIARHRQGEQVGIRQLPRLEQSGAFDLRLLKQADAIGPELVLGVAGQFRQQRQHHSRWAWTMGVARLAQDAQHRALTQGTGGPAIRLTGANQPWAGT